LYVVYATNILIVGIKKTFFTGMGKTRQKKTPLSGASFFTSFF